MDEEYDIIVLGTGLTECVLSGLLSVGGKKVLHMDENEYYGGDSASLNLTQTFQKFRKNEAPPASLGRDRDWAIDLIPKFLMANGDLTNMLVHTDVTRYLEFKQIAGSYVYRDGKIAKVPASEMEAVRSPLMGMFEKRRMKKFFEFVGNYRAEDSTTHQGLNLNVDSMAKVYEKFGLERGTQDFIGHAIALYLDDAYINKPAKEAYERILLYLNSVQRYCGRTCFLYPLYGLGELPQGFARLAAIYGSTYMLNKKIDEVVYENGVAVGVRSGEEIAKAKKIIGDPSYFPEKVKKVGTVIRAICILTHPIPNTDNLDSVQIIIPQNQIGRQHDIYIASVSSAHNVCAKDHWLAIVSTIVETDNPHVEIQAGLNLLGPVFDKFVEVKDILEPIDDGTKDHVYVSKSYDATSHFETTTEDVRDIYERVEGHPLVLDAKDKRLTVEEEQAQFCS